MAKAVTKPVTRFAFAADTHVESTHPTAETSPVSRPRPSTAATPFVLERLTGTCTPQIWPVGQRSPAQL